MSKFLNRILLYVCVVYEGCQLDARFLIGSL